MSNYNVRPYHNYVEEKHFHREHFTKRHIDGFQHPLSMYHRDFLHSEDKKRLLSTSLNDVDHGYLVKRLEGSAEQELARHFLDSRASDPKEFVIARDVPIPLERS